LLLDLIEIYIYIYIYVYIYVYTYVSKLKTRRCKHSQSEFTTEPLWPSPSFWHRYINIRTHTQFLEICCTIRIEILKYDCPSFGLRYTCIHTHTHFLKSCRAVHKEILKSHTVAKFSTYILNLVYTKSALPESQFLAQVYICKFIYRMSQKLPRHTLRLLRISINSYIHVCIHI